MYETAIFMTERYFLYPTADLKSLVVWDIERQHMLGQLEGRATMANMTMRAVGSN